MSRRNLRFLPVVLAVPALAGCGSSSPGLPTIEPARVYSIADFKPTGAVRAGGPTRISFVIRQPDGTPLTRFKTGSGPHTGVHLIFVRGDLAQFIHRHPPISADGTVTQTVTFPAPGVYRIVADVFPESASQPNFQLFEEVRVAGGYRPEAIPPPEKAVEAAGFRLSLSGPVRVKALQAKVVTVTVTDAQGRPAQLAPWLGALAHAIFFRRGTLDYFHTHVCGPAAVGCTSVLGPANVMGTAPAPGKLSVGILLPAPGTWRMFLQTRAGSRVLTAPFTLRVT
jgi:hypothetical protein